MRSINHFIAQAILLLACILPASAQGYDPNQGMYGQPGYPQQGYQQFNGLPQTTPNYGYQDPSYQQQQYAAQPQQQYAQAPQYAQGQPQQQPQLQQQYAQYGQMPAAPTYYGQAQQSTPGASWPASGGTSQTDQQTPGSFLNQGNSTPQVSDLPDTGSPDDNTVTDQPSGGSKGGAMIKGAAGMLGKFVGGASKVAAPAASIYLMNKAAGGRMRFYAPAPMMPGMGGMGMGYNPYMGVGMRRMMGGW